MLDSKELEYKIAEGLSSYYNIDVVKNNNNTLYNVKHITNLFNIKKPNKFVKKCNSKDITIINDVTYFTYKGLIKVFHTFDNYDDLENILYNIDIDFLNNSYVATNIDILKQIQRVFSNETTILHHRILNYKVDLFFPDYNIIVECDDLLYKKSLGKLIDDKDRDNNIKMRLKECSFIRYDPYEEKFDSIELFNKIYTEIMNKTKNYNSIILNFTTI
jgi:hypothetical protein